MIEILQSEGPWVDPLESQIFLLEIGAVVFDTRSNVTCFWTEENIEDELGAVDLWESIISMD